MLNKHSLIFNIFLYTLFIVLCVIMFYPLWDVVVGSFMTLGEYAQTPIKIWPTNPTLNAYTSLFEDTDMFTPLRTTVLLTIIGTVLSLSITSACAYAVSRRYLYGRKVLLRLILFTMLFSGGLMPTYMVVRMLGLINTFWVLVLLPMVSAYNLIVMRTFFASIPDSLEESAFIDGANDLVIFVRIMIPVSMPIIATMILFIGVGYWNDMYTCLYYINDTAKEVLQLTLYRRVAESGKTFSMTDSMMVKNVAPKTQRMACVVFCTVPILVVYPFLQKYFVKGVMLGSIKE